MDTITDRAERALQQLSDALDEHDMKYAGTTGAQMATLRLAYLQGRADALTPEPDTAEQMEARVIATNARR